MPQGECPWCVRVTCQHTVRRDGHMIWPCRWSGYRPRGDARKTCPWCGTSGSFTVASVFHKLSTICVSRRKATQ